MTDLRCLCVKTSLIDQLKIYLTHETARLPSCRNQSIDLLCKSIDWFLYGGNLGI